MEIFTSTLDGGFKCCQAWVCYGEGEVAALVSSAEIAEVAEH